MTSHAAVSEAQRSELAESARVSGAGILRRPSSDEA